jgi:alcohol dehydrogenase class IV
MRFNLPAATAKLAELARVAHAPGGDQGSEAARANAFITWLGTLKAEIGIPARLSDYRSSRPVVKADLDRLADVAVADICHQTNPRPCTRGDFERIFAESL